jgi:hypothetical protein
LRGVRSGEVRVELDEHDLGNGQLRRPGNLPGDELCDECLRSLACAAEFQHIHAIIVGFDDGRQRATLVQRCDISSGADDSHAAILSKCTST